MNFTLSQMPERVKKPREHGITMVMDKGLSIEETKNFLSIAGPYVDVVKLGFGTSYVTVLFSKPVLFGTSWKNISLPVRITVLPIWK